MFFVFSFFSPFFPPSFVSVCVCAALLSLLCAQWFCSPFPSAPAESVGALLRVLVPLSPFSSPLLAWAWEPCWKVDLKKIRMSNGLGDVWI